MRTGSARLLRHLSWCVQMAYFIENMTCRTSAPLGLIRVVQTKTGKGLLVPLTSDMRSSLSAHRSLNAAYRRQSVFMLTNLRRSGAWNYHGTSQAMRKARKAIDALKWDIHSLRHAAATELYEVRCDVPIFMAVTGISEKMVRHYTARANQFRLVSKAQLKRGKQNVPKTECSNIGSCTVQTPVAEARKATRNRLLASWRSGDAADCKSVYTGSIPVLASIYFQDITASDFLNIYFLAGPASA